MDLEKILLRFFLVVAKGLTHKHYAHTVARNKDYMALVAGVGLDERLKQYVRREDKELFEQRVNLTNHIVTAVAKNLLDPFYKVPRSNSGRRVLNYTGNADEKKVKEVEDLLGKFWGDESWDDYMATRFTELNSVDPNAFVVMEFKPFDAEVEMVQPYPYEATSSMAVDYKKINKVLEYLIVKDKHTYRIKQDVVKDATAPSTTVLPDLKKEYKDGEKYTLYTKNQTFRLTQVHENHVNGLLNLTEGKPTKLGAEATEYIKLGKKYYQFETFLPHNCEQVPAVQVGYYRDLTTHGETFVSPISPAIPYLDKTIKTNSELDLVATLLAFPQLVMYAEPCAAESCYEGVDTTTNAACGVCHGTGKKATAPSAQDAIVLTMPESKEQMIPLDQIAKYIHPDVGIVKWQEEYIDKLTFNAKRIMFNSDVFDRKQIADTATGKTIDMQNVYDTLHPFAIKFGKTWRAGVMLMAKLADRAENLIATYTFGKDFKLKTLDSLIQDLSVANGIGSPSLVSHLNYDIAQIIFSEKPLELQRYKLKEMYNPFNGKSEKEVMALMAGNLVSRRDKVLHANFSRIFDELEIEYAKTNKNFYQLKRLEQREALYKKVDEIIAGLDEENPEPLADLGA